MPEIKTNYSAVELADILDVSRQAINKRANKEGWLFSESFNRQGGHIYRYEDLPDDVKVATARKLTEAEPKKILDSVRVPGWSNRIGLARFQVVTQWRDYRREQAKEGKGKTEATAAFLLAYNGGKLLPDAFATLGETQKSSLYRWDQLLQEHGDDYTALCDRRGAWTKGQKKGLGNITAEAAEAFLAAWLTPNKPSVTLAYEVMASVLKKTGAGLPSLASVYRFARRFADQNHNIYLLKRFGEKTLNDEAMPYSIRDWRKLEVGDCLFADGHTLNFECRHPETGRPFRPTLILWFEARSGLPVGWEVMPTENTVAIASALRMAIINLGKTPKVAYLDNGRAFKSKFFTGENPDFEDLSGLYTRLGIALQLARPYHGQSKTVERFFGTFNEQFSRIMPSYTGRDITDKPAWRMRNEKYHQARLKSRGLMMPDLRQVMDMFRAYVAWFAQKPAPNGQGETRAEIFNAGRGPGVDQAELDRHFLWSKKVRPKRTGFTLAGVRYESDSLFGLNQEIIIRFSWGDLGVVHLYDLDGESLGRAYPQEGVHPLAGKLGDEHDQAMVADRNRRYQRLKSGTLRAARMLDGELKEQPGLAALPYMSDRFNFDLSPAERNVMDAVLADAPSESPMEPLVEIRQRPPLYHYTDKDKEERLRLKAYREKGPKESEQVTLLLGESTGNDFKRPKLERPEWFANEFERYEWLFQVLVEGLETELSPEEKAFMQEYENSDEYENVTGARYEQLRAVYGLKKEGAC